MLTRLLVSFFFVGLISGCSNSDPVKNEKEEGKNNITADIQTITIGNSTREYVLYIPPTYDKNVSTPLMINFHGFGDSAENYYGTVGNTYELNSTADANTFIVAYPQGVERQKGDPEWDPGDNGIQDINDNDVFFARQLVSEIDREFNIDMSRVYAVGYSNGGMMSYGLACNAGDVFAAVGIMSGVMLEDDCNASTKTSVIHFHGVDDGVLPYDGNQNFQPISSVINFWLEHNEISAVNLVSAEHNDGDVTKDEYNLSSENLTVVLYTINEEFGKDGGHVWFSGDIDGTNPNQILWDFLSSFSLED